MSKEGLQKIIQQQQVDNQKQGSFFSMEDLRDLFTFHEHVRSEIHENMKCTRCERGDLMVADDMDDLSGSIDDKDSITGKDKEVAANEEAEEHDETEEDKRRHLNVVFIGHVDSTGIFGSGRKLQQQ